MQYYGADLIGDSAGFGDAAEELGQGVGESRVTVACFSLRTRATAAGGGGSARRRSEENVQRVVTGTVSEEASSGGI